MSAEGVLHYLDRLEQAEATVTTKTRAPRGFGLAYQRGRIWWVRYYVQGQEHRESTGSERRQDADRLLKNRWKQIGAGRFVGPQAEKVLVGDLLDDLEADYRQNSHRSLDTLGHRIAPLRAAFGTWRSVDLDGKAIGRYKAERLTQKTRGGSGPATMSAATVNRELAALKRAFRLGLEHGRIAHAPIIKLMAEGNVREGFVEPGVFHEIALHLADPLDDVARFAYITGWRKNEILTLLWNDVDLAARRVRLRRENSKNGEPRVLVLTDDLLALMERRCAARTYETKIGTAASPWVFVPSPWAAHRGLQGRLGRSL